MSKVIFNMLAIELTHRCNMHCAHCLRGDADGSDISKETIDALLDQTEAIHSLTLSGGEPCLRIDAMEYIAEGIERRGIALFNLCMITNGLILDPRIIVVMKRFARIVHDSRKRCGYRPILQAVQMGFSFDKYHEQRELCWDHKERYKKASSGTYDILIKQCGNKPTAKGRAVSLKEATPQPLADYSKWTEERRIEVLGDGNLPLCPFYRTAHLFSPEQKMICCNMSLLPDGKLVNGCDGEFEQEESAPAVCNVNTDDIWASIAAYNADRLPCNTWIEKYTPQIKAAAIEAAAKALKDPKSMIAKWLHPDDPSTVDYNESERERNTRYLNTLFPGDLLECASLMWQVERLSEWMKARQAKEDKEKGLTYQVEHHDFLHYREPETRDYPECVCCSIAEAVTRYI